MQIIVLQCKIQNFYHFIYQIKFKIYKKKIQRLFEDSLTIHCFISTYERIGFLLPILIYWKLLKHIWIWCPSTCCLHHSREKLSFYISFPNYLVKLIEFRLGMSVYFNHSLEIHYLLGRIFVHMYSEFINHIDVTCQDRRMSDNNIDAGTGFYYTFWINHLIFIWRST